MKTYGYDYAFALSIDLVNEILQESLDSLDLSLSFVYEDRETRMAVSGSGRMGPWSLATGGQNSHVHIDIPFQSGNLHVFETFDLTGVVVRIEASLGWLGPQSPLSGSGTDASTELAFTVTSVGDADQPGHIAPIGVPKPGGLNNLAQTLLKNATAEALARNKDKVEHVLAGINPAPSQVGAWLSPKRWRYVYSQTDDGQGALCVLAVLTDRDLPDPAFDATALKPGKIALLISQQSFFDNVISPPLRSLFPDARLSLTCQNESCTLSNQSDFTLGRVTAHSFSLTTSDDGNGLKARSQGGGPLKFLFGLADLPDASYWWDVSITNPLTYENGNVSFAQDNNPTEHQGTTIYWYDWILLAAVGIVNAAGLASTIYDLVTGFGNQVQEVGITNINDALQNSLDGTVVHLANVVDWRWGNRTFTPESAELDGAFHVTGSLT